MKVLSLWQLLCDNAELEAVLWDSDRVVSPAGCRINRRSHSHSEPRILRGFEEGENFLPAQCEPTIARSEVTLRSA